MTYKLTKEADTDIINIYVEGTDGFGVVQAEKYHAELKELFRLLSQNPMLARERLEINPPVRIQRHKSHMIVYHIDENDDVIIIRIRHVHEDWKTGHE